MRSWPNTIILTRGRDLHSTVRPFLGSPESLSSPLLTITRLSLSLLLRSSHNIVLQCDIKYLQDESAGWSRRVCDPYLGIDSELVRAGDQAKAGAMRTLTRNARHSDRRLSYSDWLLSHAQNLTFVLGHYFPKKYLVFYNIDCLSKIDPFNCLSQLVIFFCESEGINKLCWTFGQQIYHLNVFVCLLSLNKSR